MYPRNLFLSCSVLFIALSTNAESVGLSGDAMDAPGAINVHTIKVDFGQLGIRLLTSVDLPSNAKAGVEGAFGPTINWPLIPIHLTLLPDGRVLSFGRELVVKKEMIHSIWDPSLGTGPEAHTIIPNPHNTDVFCAGQTVIPATGETLIAGGTARNGKLNYSVDSAHLLDNQTGQLIPDTPMAFKRWYPTLVTLSTGDVVILGGRDDKDIPTFASTPELYSPGIGFKTLPGAISEGAYGKTANSWNYPRGFLAPNGKVFILAHLGNAFWLDPYANQGNGSVVQEPNFNATQGFLTLPSIMYAPGKILTIRSTPPTPNKSFVIDLNGPIVTKESVNSPSKLRFFSSTTVMADGKVFLNGGSEVGNQLVGVSYRGEIWDPKTKLWSLAARATKPRLYHSNALLLPDGAVLTGGGGASGPVFNMNAEIYYPPYLYRKDGSGLPAERPNINTAPVRVIWNKSFGVNYTSSSPVSKVTFVRAGSATHALNVDQRYIELPFTQIANVPGRIRITSPINSNIAPPGDYMLFIFDQNGVPSISKLIHLG